MFFPSIEGGTLKRSPITQEYNSLYQSLSSNKVILLGWKYREPGCSEWLVVVWLVGLVLQLVFAMDSAPGGGGLTHGKISPNHFALDHLKRMLTLFNLMFAARR